MCLHISGEMLREMELMSSVMRKQAVKRKKIGVVGEIEPKRRRRRRRKKTEQMTMRERREKKKSRQSRISWMKRWWSSVLPSFNSACLSKSSIHQWSSSSSFWPEMLAPTAEWRSATTSVICCSSFMTVNWWSCSIILTVLRLVSSQTWVAALSRCRTTDFSMTASVSWESCISSVCSAVPSQRTLSTRCKCTDMREKTHLCTMRFSSLSLILQSWCRSRLRQQSTFLSRICALTCWLCSCTQSQHWWTTEMSASQGSPFSPTTAIKTFLMVVEVEFSTSYSFILHWWKVCSSRMLRVHDEYSVTWSTSMSRLSSTFLSTWWFWCIWNQSSQHRSQSI